MAKSMTAAEMIEHQDRKEAKNKKKFSTTSKVKKVAANNIPTRIGKPSRRVIFSLFPAKPVFIEALRFDSKDADVDDGMFKKFNDDKFCNNKIFINLHEEVEDEFEDMSHSYLGYLYQTRDRTQRNLRGGFGVWLVRDDVGDNEWLISAKNAAAELRESGEWTRMWADMDSSEYILEPLDTPTGKEPDMDLGGKSAVQIVFDAFGDDHTITSLDDTIAKMILDEWWTPGEE